MKKFLGTTLAIVLLSIGAAFLSHFGDRAASVSPSDWRAGDIISDHIFTNKDSMSVTQIQAWLDDMMNQAGGCDVNGTKPSEWGGGTRAQYGASRGNPAPFTCLNIYYEVPKTSPGPGVPASNYGKSTIPAGAKSAAQLIYDAAQTYNISPQVLLVKLGTESAGLKYGLIQDTWPFKNQYTYAMGAHCPDSGPGGSANCNTDYAGFSLQMREAAKLMRSYLDGMDEPWWGCVEGGKKVQCAYNRSGGSDPGGGYKVPYTTNYILWNVRPSGCGGSNIAIKNKATAALYTYTPYQPNSASLNAFPGTGNSCSSYGNRNFWWVFNNWFGSTTDPQVAVGWLNTEDAVYTGQATKAWFWVRNTSKTTINLGKIKVAVRSADGKNYDFTPVDNVKLKPGQTYSYSQSRSLPAEGEYTLFIARYSGGSWLNPPFSDLNNDSVVEITKTVINAPTVSQGIEALRSTKFHKNQPVKATFKVKNNSQLYPVNIGRIKVVARDSRGGNVDFPSSPVLTLAPGQTYTYNESRSFASTGTHKLWIDNYRQGRGWDKNFPASSSSSATRQLSVDVLDSVTLTSPLTTSGQYRGQPVSATFAVKNHSNRAINIGRIKVVARDSRGGNVDFPSSPVLTLAPGQTYTYNESRSFASTGTHKLWIDNYRQGRGWDKNFPESETSGMLRQKNLVIKSDAVVSTGLTVSSQSPKSGQSITAKFTITNRSSQSVTIDKLIAAVRDKSNANHDFALARKVTIPAGKTYTYSASRSFAKKGDYRVWVAASQPATGWTSSYPASTTANITRSINIAVK